MIKTVSFAPPRSARAAAKTASKSASNPAKVQPARAAVAVASSITTVTPKPATTQPARPTSGSSITPQAEEAAAPRRRPSAETSQMPEAVDAFKAAPKKARAVKAAPTTEVDQSEVDQSGAFVEKTPAKRVARKTAEVAEQASLFQPAPDEDVPKQAPEIKVAPKVKRSRAPKDLALQYGGALETEIAPRVIAEKPAPRKRMTREAKAARSQMLRPDDNVLQRLQQANAIEVKKPATRGRGWEFECGRCGRVSRFQTQAAICQCGAIAVRE